MYCVTRSCKEVKLPQQLVALLKVCLYSLAVKVERSPANLFQKNGRNPATGELSWPTLQWVHSVRAHNACHEKLTVIQPSQSDSPSGELIGRRVRDGRSRFVVGLQYVDIAATFADFGVDVAVATSRRWHKSTFAFWTWNAGVIQTPQGHLSPLHTTTPLTFRHTTRTSLTFRHTSNTLHHKV